MDEIRNTNIQNIYEYNVFYVFYFFKGLFMRNLYLFLISVGLIIACKNDTKPNDLLPDRNVNVSIDINLPMYQNLLVPGGWAYTPTTAEYGFKGILVYNKNGNYIAYDRACPHLAVSDCTAMIFDGLYLKCSCDNSTFNIFNGGVSTTVDFQAREYHVEIVSSNILRISNY
jgi:nitrite reductase/ring-hydroxylating ferredoxin subunit